jgi:hypothetical protein
VLIEQAMTSRLAGLLGHSRIYPDGMIPQGQNVWPCVVYDHAGDDNAVRLSGGRSGIRIDSFNLEIIGVNRLAVATTREQIVDAFAGSNCRGVWGGVGGIFVTGAVASDANADAVDPQDGTETLYRTERLTLKINWRKD